jgi:hypothetical protein
MLDLTAGHAIALLIVIAAVSVLAVAWAVWGRY